jgi:hypothetical protein
MDKIRSSTVPASTPDAMAPSISAPSISSLTPYARTPIVIPPLRGDHQQLVISATKIFGLRNELSNLNAQLAKLKGTLIPSSSKKWSNGRIFLIVAASVLGVAILVGIIALIVTIAMKRNK